MALNFSLPSKHRIKKRSDFVRMQKGSKKLYGKHFLILIKPSSITRIGITVTKKIDKRAAVRNSIKRKVREVFRLNRFRLNGNFDIVVIARRGSEDLDFFSIEQDVMEQLRYGKYISEDISEDIKSST